jgi:hypothetical protein
VKGESLSYLIILLPPQNHRSPGTSPLGLTSLKRKNLPIVVTLGGIGSCYASLAFYFIAFLLATNCAITAKPFYGWSQFGNLGPKNCLKYF